MRTALAAVLLIALTACGAPSTTSSPPSTPATTQSKNLSTTSATTSTVSQPCGSVARPPAYEHVVWIVMENHGRDQVVGSSKAPYLNSLIARCGLATNAHAVAHPSLPNYIAMTSGGTQGITDSGTPDKHPLAVANLFSQLGPGRWRSLAESMPKPCFKENQGTYVARHHPPTYYTNLVGQCERQAVPLASVPDLSAPFTLVVPNQRSNTHDTDVPYGDAWLARFVPSVLSSPEYASGRTVVVITYDEDEDDGNAANPITTVVVSPSTRPGTRDATYFTHYSLLRTTEELLGLGLLGQAAGATSMQAAFNL